MVNVELYESLIRRAQYPVELAQLDTELRAAEEAARRDMNAAGRLRRLAQRHREWLELADEEYAK